MPNTADGTTIIIVMGPSGAGKSTVGARLARTLGWPFLDGDDLQPPANIRKMQSGVPLTDADRCPWLKRVREHIDAFLADGQSAVIACSALRNKHRDYLRADSAVHFVYLEGGPLLFAERIRRRSGHFMPPSLITSQFRELEEPKDAVRIDATLPVDAIVRQVTRNLAKGLARERPTKEES